MTFALIYVLASVATFIYIILNNDHWLLWPTFWIILLVAYFKKG